MKIPLKLKLTAGFFLLASSALWGVMASTLGSDVSYAPGSIGISVANGMKQVPDEPWTFISDSYDPYTGTIVFPSLFDTSGVKAIGVEIEKTDVQPGEIVEIFPLLNDGQGASMARRLTAPLRSGVCMYVFETEGIRWFKGGLSSLRIDPCSAPGKVQIREITVYAQLPKKQARMELIRVPDDMKVSLGEKDDTFKQANRLRYRLSSEYIDFALLDSFGGVSKVLKMSVRNSSEQTKLVSLAFAQIESLRPFSPNIPPYVGLDSNQLTLKTWVDDPADLANAAIEIVRKNGERETLPFDVKTVRAKKWTEFSWPLKQSDDLRSQIVNVEFICNVSPNKNYFVHMADMCLSGEVEGKTFAYDLLNTEAPLLTTGMMRPLAEKPERSLPQRQALSLGGVELHDPAYASRVGVLSSLIKKEFPDWDLVLAPVWTPQLVMKEILETLPEGVYFQFQKAQLDFRYPRAVDAMPRNAQGEPLADFGNALMITHPVIREGIKDQIDYAASLGVNNFKQVDMVWPFFGGRWGYDDATVAVFRDSLSDRDEGLLLRPGLPGKLSKGGRIGFWDYYEYYHGFRLQPKDLGLKTWDDYTPITERAASDGGAIERRNLGVFILLYHYEWLRMAQQLGRWAKAHDGSHSFTLNPEDLGNGGDYVFLTYLEDAGMPYFEWFGGPSIMRSAYHNLPLYIQAGKQAKKDIGMILEIGMGGHGQHYLAPEINYLYGFELAAGGFRNYHNEWAEPPMMEAIEFSPAQNPPLTYGQDRWNSWMDGALGFVYARENEIRRPETRVYNISMRSPGYYINSWLWSIEQRGSLGPVLADKHVPYKQWDRSAMPEILDQADVIIYNPPFSRPEDAAALREWLKSPGKSLVLHSNAPFHVDSGEAFLAPGTDRVEWFEMNDESKGFVNKKHGFDVSLFPELKSVRPTKDGQWSKIVGAEVILGERNSPLISKVSTEGGSAIYYLHRAPQKLTQEEKSAVGDALIKALNLPTVVENTSAPILVHRFTAPEYEVLDIWTGLDLPGFKAGYGPHLMYDRGPGQFDASVRPYPYRLSGVDVTFEVPVKEPGSYCVYAFLSGEEQTLQTNEQGRLPLSVKGVSAEQFLIAKDTPKAREMIEQLKTQRTRILPYSPDLPRK